MEVKMSDYEFWKDLGNIFDAILNYQKKNVEFNNRFINPWIRLGNIFDREDQHKQAVQAYQHATEIDPDSSQNWMDLGDAQFKAGAYEQAMAAYKKAAELDPKAGWPLSNLALILVTQGQCEEAVNLYLASIDLLTQDKDKAVSWNRLGNAYRKLNDYENAFLAFQKADELDSENTGFKDQLDETTESSTMVAPEEVLVQMSLNQSSEIDEPVESVEETVQESSTEVPQPEANVTIEASSESLIVADAPQETITLSTNIEVTVEQVVSVTETPAAPQETSSSIEVTAEAETDPAPDESVDEEGVFESESEPLPVWLTEEIDESQVEEVIEKAASLELLQPVAQIIEEIVALSESNTPQEPTAEVPAEPQAVEEVVATETAAVVEEVTVLNDDPKTEAIELVETVETTQVAQVDPAFNTSSTSLEIAETYTEFTSTAMVTPSTLEDTQPTKAFRKETIEQALVVETVAQSEVKEEASPDVQEVSVKEESVAVVESSSDKDSPIPSVNSEAAYEEYLKDAVEPVSTLADHLDEIHSGVPETKVSETGDVRIAMDTQNAHVWNELGNVYLNSGACDDAIAAYGKAIELDRQFAWPYSNLALAYVQKNRFAEAILLYQRSIELFVLDKDKAVTWNRLGNVYRRLNDYDNAIAAYQTADDLDPDNATLSLRSHYGLLGNLYMDQKPNYVS
jgi:tetratricopeptide (TPR) repeat protein